MFTLSVRKVAIVAVLGAGSVLSAGAFAAQAATTPTADDVVRPASVTTTYGDTPDLRGDGTLEDYGINDGLRRDDTLDDDYLDDDGVEDEGVEDEGVEDDGVEDDDIDVDGTDDGVAPTPAPVAVPTDADHPQGDDSGHEYSGHENSGDDDSASDDDSADDSDDAGDDSGHGGEED